MGENENNVSIALAAQAIINIEKRLDKLEGNLKAVVMTIIGIVIAAVLKQVGFGG